MHTQTLRARLETALIYIAFALYLAFLLKLLILSRHADPAARAINLIPFGSIIDYLRGGTDTVRRFAFSNVAGNIAAFVPLGACLPFLRRDKRVLRNLLIVFGASLLVELIQGLFAIGSADIDDLILNTLGGLLGIGGYRLLSLLLRKESTLRTVYAILSVLSLPILYYYLAVIQLRL